MSISILLKTGLISFKTLSIMGLKFQILWFLTLVGSLMLCILINGSIHWFFMSKQLNHSFKHSLRAESLIQKESLLQKMTDLKAEVEKSPQQAFRTDNPYIDFIISQPIKPAGKALPQSLMQQAFKDLPPALAEDQQETPPPLVLAQALKYQNRVKILKSLLPEQLDLENLHFVKIKAESFAMIFYSPQKKHIVAVFLKPLFFKQISKEIITRSKIRKVSFSTFNKNQDLFFYSHKKREQQKLLLSFMPSFFKDPKPQFINIHSKARAKQYIYYIQPVGQSNLVLLSKKIKSLSFLETVFLKKSVFVIYILVLVVLLFFLLWLLYYKALLLMDAFVFLKKSFISFAKVGSFPLWQSKNPLLFFYENRKMILKPEGLAKGSQELPTEDKQTYQLQDIVNRELQRIQSLHPQLIVNKDFQTDIKMFGFERFLKILLNELLSNAVQSMGTVNPQKIDISIKEEQNFLVLSVRDYGTGVSDIKKAFQIYHSTKSQPGLGLNLVQSIVQANGGEISLENLPESGGTLACIRLPFSCFIKN